MEKTKITIIPNGPMIVHGDVCITNSDGSETKKEGRASFCRCGVSKNKPFCDGAHKSCGFEG